MAYFSYAFQVLPERCNSGLLFFNNIPGSTFIFAIIFLLCYSLQLKSITRLIPKHLIPLKRPTRSPVVLSSEFLPLFLRAGKNSTNSASVFLPVGKPGYSFHFSTLNFPVASPTTIRAW